VLKNKFCACGFHEFEFIEDGTKIFAQEMVKKETSCAQPVSELDYGCEQLAKL